MKVLVTGAAGFIGAALTRSLSDSGIPVVALDGLLDGLYPADEKKTRFRHVAELPGVQALTLDLRTDDLGVIPGDVTHVVNEAAMPGLSLSWVDTELYIGCNLQAVSRLVEASATWPLQKFIQVSTSSVYGRNAVGDESLATEPVSPYGVTKLAAEHLVLAHWRDSGLPVSILRYFSVYGPGQRPDMAYRKFIDRALSGSQIDVYGSGEQSRSNTYIDDCVTATTNALTSARPGEVYNIAGGEERSLNDALSIIEGLTGAPLEIHRHPSARGDQDRTSGDTAKAQRELGLTHSVSLDEGLARQFAWQLELSRG